MRAQSLTRRASRAGWAALLAGALAYLAASAVGAHELDALPWRLFPDGLVAIAALVCTSRGILRAEARRAWLPLGIALCCWAAGDLWYSLALLDDPEPPIPSAADGLWLAFYPAAAIGLLALARQRIGRLHPTLLLDGLVAAIAVAAIGIAVAGRPILDAPGGGFWVLATVLAYPIADVVLLAIVAGVAAATAWHPGRTWALVAAALAACAVTDGYFAYAVATQPEVNGTPLDGLWPAAMLVIAFAAWRPEGFEGTRDPATWRTLLLPSVFAGASLAILASGRVWPVPVAAWSLAVVALLGAILRGALSFAENQRISVARRREALTDALTGLGNRRRLVEDLAAALADEGGALVMLDLDGFKSYNDTFGHPAGDGILAHLGGRLVEAMGADDRAYRLGGDEFCVLTAGSDPERIRALGETAAAALCHREEEVRVGCSWGSVILGTEASTVEAALRLADERLYHRKNMRLRSAAGQQARNVLISALAEREPGLGGHVGTVTELALAVARRLGIPESDHETIAAGAQLHDIGKLAIPDQILQNPGPLDDLEWVFMRQHTLIGERIVSAAPALGPAAAVVRATHERWDGGGYPDGLRGRAIPVGARIVAVCDAYDAMTTGRPYDRPRSQEEALAELDRCAGSQFDPAVVAALKAELADDAARATSGGRQASSTEGVLQAGGSAAE